MSRRSSPPATHRQRSRSPGRTSRDDGYGARLGNGPDRGPSRRYDPREDRDRRPGASGRRGGGASGSYTSRDREGERRGERDRYDETSRRDDDVDDLPPPPKSPPKPNFNPSGLLAAETNTVLVPGKEGNGAAGTKGVILKYNEPPEARKPTKNWRLYVFKGKEQVDLIHLHRQSAYLVGRDQVVSDIPVAHPSASKQHAVIQFRQMTEKNEFGDSKTAIKPFLIDLDSTNGTFVNDQEIPTSRYYELRQSDVLKFAQSTREYVLLHEESA